MENVINPACQLDKIAVETVLQYCKSGGDS